jgi:hypothetical protein
VQDVDRLADLRVRVDGDERRDVPVLGGQDLLDADDLGTFHQAVLQQPGVRVRLREVVAAGVGKDHHHRRPAGELGGHRERGDDRGPRGRADQDPLSRVILRAMRNASRSETRT